MVDVLYSGSLTRKLVDEPNDRIVAVLVEMGDDDELIDTPFMRKMVYELQVYDRGIAILQAAFVAGQDRFSTMRVAQIKIAMANLERRKPASERDMVLVERWMWDAGRVAYHNLNMPHVRRTKILWEYNSALICRLKGDFAGEAKHHHEIAVVAIDRFSARNAVYMREMANLLHRVKVDEARPVDWADFLLCSDEYWSGLRKDVPREAQWIANVWSHRVQLAVLLGRFGDPWIKQIMYCGHRGLDVPETARWASKMAFALLAVRRPEYDAIVLAEGIANNLEASDEWRMLAKLHAAHVICSVFPSTGAEKAEALRAVISMPGDGICHAARAVAERMLATC